MVVIIVQNRVEMILCSGIDTTVRVCMYVRERERHKMYIDTENTQANVLTKEKDSTTYKVGGGCFI